MDPVVVEREHADHVVAVTEGEAGDRAEAEFLCPFPLGPGIDERVGDDYWFVEPHRDADEPRALLPALRDRLQIIRGEPCGHRMGDLRPSVPKVETAAIGIQD